MTFPRFSVARASCRSFRYADGLCRIQRLPMHGFTKRSNSDLLQRIFWQTCGCTYITFNQCRIPGQHHGAVPGIRFSSGCRRNGYKDASGSEMESFLRIPSFNILNYLYYYDGRRQVAVVGAKDRETPIRAEVGGRERRWSRRSFGTPLFTASKRCRIRQPPVHV